MIINVRRREWNNAFHEKPISSILDGISAIDRCDRWSAIEPIVAWLWVTASCVGQMAVFFSPPIVRSYADSLFSVNFFPGLLTINLTVSVVAMGVSCRFVVPRVTAAICVLLSLWSIAFFAFWLSVFYFVGIPAQD